MAWGCIVFLAVCSNWNLSDFELSRYLGPALLPPEEVSVLIGVQCLPCLFLLLVPESLCSDYSLLVEPRVLSSALDRHGTNELLYFVCQALPARLLVLLQGSDDLVQSKRKRNQHEMDRLSRQTDTRGWACGSVGVDGNRRQQFLG